MTGQPSCKAGHPAGRLGSFATAGSEYRCLVTTGPRDLERPYRALSCSRVPPANQHF